VLACASHVTPSFIHSLHFDYLAWLTDMGESGMIVPLSAALFIVLWRVESSRAAWLFGRSMLLATLGIIALKLFFLCAGERLGSSIVSPSGHACMSSSFYGLCACLFWARQRNLLGMLGILAATALIVAIAISRVLIKAHTAPEVLLGSGLGLLSVALFAFAYLRQPPAPLRHTGVMLLLLPVCLLSYGLSFPGEELLRSTVPWLRSNLCCAN
jgi:membrane-associated phospholipid phosphatase